MIHASYFERHDLLYRNLRWRTFFGKHQAANQDRLVFGKQWAEPLVLCRENHALNTAFQILDLHQSPRLALAGALALNGGQNSTECYFGALSKSLQIRGAVSRELRDLIFVLIQRMARNVKSEHFFFADQLFRAGPVGYF